MNDTITISTKTGRNISGADHGRVTHARLNGSNKAICGTEPGRRGGWSEYSQTMSYREACAKAWGKGIITCPRCEKALYKLFDRPSLSCSFVR